MQVLNDGVWLLLVLWACFHGSGMSYILFFFSLNYTKLLLSCNKPAFEIPAGAQLDLLSWMEANNLQTQWVLCHLGGRLPQSCQLTRGCCAGWAPLPKHWQEPGAPPDPGAAAWGTLSLLKQQLVAPIEFRQDVDLSLLVYSPSWHVCLALTNAVTRCGLTGAVTAVAWAPW